MKLKRIVPLAMSLLFALNCSPMTVFGADESTTDRKGPQKFALLVGIDDYLPAGESNGDLGGCVKDIKDIKTMLKDCGFKDDSEHMVTLLNTDATHANIVAAFKSHLIENAKKNPDGVFVLHYSGHGAGGFEDVDKDEMDGTDECIFPADLEPMLDDELYELGNELTSAVNEKGNVTFILDCCYSGTGTRGPDGKLRVRKAPDELVKIAKSKMTAKKTRGGSNNSESNFAKNAKSTTISACLSTEEEPETLDPPGESNGVLTRHLTEIMADAKNRCSYRDLKERLTAIVPGIYGRHPQIEGDLDKIVFTGDSNRTSSFITVTPGEGKIVELKAGKAQGMVPGGIVAIYDQNTLDLKSKSGRLGDARVTTVDGLTSKAELLADIPAEKLDGAKAVLVTPFFGSGSYTVIADESANPSLNGSAHKKFIDDFAKKITPVDDTQNKISLVRVKSQSEVLGKKDWDLAVVNETYDSFKKRWAGTSATSDRAGDSISDKDAIYFLIGPDGLPISDYFVKATDPNAVAKLSDWIVKRSKQKALLALSNQQSELKNSFTVRALRVLDPGGAKKRRPEAVEPIKDATDSSARLKVGDIFALELTNNSETPLYASVIVVTTDGSIVLAYPPKGAEEALVQGKPVQTEILQAGTPRGIDSFKVLLTTKPADFSFLEQEGVTRAGPKSGLARLLFEGLEERRNLKVFEVPEPEDWDATTYSIEVM